MFVTHRIRIGKAHAKLCAAAFVCFSLSPFVFAGDAGASQRSGQPPLVTMEQVYRGMQQAEQKRIALGGADSAIDNRQMREAWGVQIISTGFADSDYWLEFRFRVLDPDKAAPLFDSMTDPYLESDADKKIKLGVPEGERADAQPITHRDRNVQAGKIYSIMFANPKGLVKPGQKVTVVAGEFRAEHMTVLDNSQHLHAKLRNSGIMEVPPR
jgi:hypothetical protein